MNILASVSMTTLDWSIIGVFFVIVIGIGYVASRTAGKSTSEFFLGGRGMPWWLLGVSMVACTFSADTPNLVTGFVREGGVSKNWAWWVYLMTGMVTVFVYAKLWRRSEVMTDLEYYELRYSGKNAAFLRGFRSLFLGLLFNVMIMGTVTLAIIKYGQIMFGIEPWQCVLYGSIGVVIYATLGGIKGVIWADFFQYSIAMFGAVWAAYVAIKQPEIQAIGGLSGMLNTDTSPIADKLNIFPDFSNLSMVITVLVIPITVQWWATWYPGAEPGGGGYIAQKMLSAKNEKNAIGATLFFNFMHYAIRPWPWIVVALASLIVYEMDSPDAMQQAKASLEQPAMVQLAEQIKTAPGSVSEEALAEFEALQYQASGLTSLRENFPSVDKQYLAHDVAYPAMITKLGPGMLGIVIASIIAAYMSTIGTHLNWGSSYIVNDFYARFVKKDASQKELVTVGRICTVGLMVLTGVVALTFLESATQAFDLLILSGAGTGAIYILRWFWWRITAMTEVVAMFAAIGVAIILLFVIKDGSLALTFGEVEIDHATVRLLLAVFINMVIWISVTFLSKPTDKEQLYEFYKRTRPGGPGWAKLRKMAEEDGVDIEGVDKGKAWELPYEILCVLLGTIMIYGCLFSIGNIVYGNVVSAIVLGAIAAVCCVGIFSIMKRTRVG